MLESELVKILETCWTVSGLLEEKFQPDESFKRLDPFQLFFACPLLTAALPFPAYS